MTKRAQLGMAMFLISEAVFFFLLILACVYLRALPSLIAPSGWSLTALLLASSLCLWRGWRWGTVALGAVFVAGLFGTTFALLTAVHGLFVLRRRDRARRRARRPALRALSLYWYFFTAVWLVIFLVSRGWDDSGTGSLPSLSAVRRWRSDTSRWCASTDFGAPYFLAGVILLLLDLVSPIDTLGDVPLQRPHRPAFPARARDSAAAAARDPFASISGV